MRIYMCECLCEHALALRAVVLIVLAKCSVQPSCSESTIDMAECVEWSIYNIECFPFPLSFPASTTSGYLPLTPHLRPHQNLITHLFQHHDVGVLHLLHDHDLTLQIFHGIALGLLGLPPLLPLLLLLLVVGLDVQFAHCLQHKHGIGHSCLHVYVCCRYCCCCFWWLASMSNLRTACSTNTALAIVVCMYTFSTHVCCRYC